MFPIFITIGLLAFPIIVGGLAIIQIELKDKKKKRQEEMKQRQQDYETAQEKIHKENFYKEVYKASWEHNGELMEIRNLPRLSFEQWLIFYNSAPEHWHINLEEYHGKACIFPNYIKDNIDINIVWETPDDLHKFIMWQKNEYKNGDVAIFEEERARQMTKLTKALRDDIKARNEQTQKELAELEKQIIDNMPKSKEEDPIQKCLREQREKKSNKLTSIEKVIESFAQEYPDYNYSKMEKMVTDYNSILLSVTFTHKHKPGNIIQRTYIYNEVDKIWEEVTTQTTMG